ncbi:DNA polymerase III subunit delta [Hippea maritima]|uniref:DNA polymerase III delta n=1 Tax=Hippea maritima (strain ATCC 700847 / DSM 10411 / MH2) TaxID=760142 RepID=F2LUN2_HIPMA|nr:DNA polymerase III subunit delta [Hippea maritima]AEA34622.1 DNA polymerase III delta [Hippea maritima DSM 10411]
MNQKQLKAQLKSKKVENFYIFCGDDYFIKDLYAKRIAKTKGAQIRKVVITDEAELRQIMAKALSKPLFQAKPLLLYGVVSTDLPKNLSITPPTHNILILDLERCKEEKENTVIFKPPKASEIASFIKNAASRNNKTITDEAVRLLSRSFEGKNTSYLKNTVDELLLLTYNKKQIEKEDAEKCLTLTANFDIKDIIDMVKTKDFVGIVEKIGQILSQIPPSLFVHIFSGEITKIIASCYCSQDCLRQTFKVFYPTPYTQLCKDIGENALKRLIKALYEIDKTLKSSSDEFSETMIKARLLLWMQGL